MRAPAQTTERDPTARRVLVVALSLAAVRFVFLGRWSLWLDEVYTLTDARHGEDIANPLGYRLFDAFYALVPGRPDEFWLRLPAALLGWACVPAAAWALRPFVGPRAAAWSALVLAVAPWHVYWSQTARFYTLAQLLCLVGLRASVDGLRGRRGGLLPLAAGLVALGAAAATHPSAVMLIGGLVVAALAYRLAGRWPGGPEELVRGRDTWRLFGALVAGGALVSSFWVVRVWVKWEERQGSGNPLHLLLSAGYLVTPGVGLALLAGLWCAWHQRRAWAGFLFTALVAGAVAALGASFFLRVSAQYVFVFLPLAVALGGLALADRDALPRALRGALVVLVLAPLVLETTAYFALRHGDRPRWREAYRTVFERCERTDLVVGMDAPVGEYYWNPLSDDLRRLTRLVWLDEFRAKEPLEWARYGRRVWLVVNHEQFEDWPAVERATMLRFLGTSCAQVERLAVPWNPRDLDVVVYAWEPGVLEAPAR